jgi:hypothetical protein
MASVGITFRQVHRQYPMQVMVPLPDGLYPKGLSLQDRHSIMSLVAFLTCTTFHPVVQQQQPQPSMVTMMMFFDSPHHHRVERRYQLLLNYCYGNKDESSMLLCPYGPGVNYINHNQSLANVQVRWAAHGTTAHNSSCLHLSPHEMLTMGSVGLGFDFEAIGDIAQGTELFLDYGYAWEAAWQTHVQQWATVVAAPSRHEWWNYTSAAQWNQILADDPSSVLQTYDEVQQQQQQQRNTSNLELRCHSNLPKILKSKKIRLKWPMDEYGIPCRILSRWHEETTNRIVYDIKWTEELEEEHDDDDKDGPDKLQGTTRNITLCDVPREGIKFVDLPYTTDLHLKEAFRHEIAIPEHMVPAKWKDL